MHSTLKTESERIAIVEKIASTDRLQQLEAESALESGDPAYFEALLTILERENRKKRRRYALALIGASIVIVASQLGLGASGTFAALWFVFVAIAAHFAPTALQKAAAARLAESNNIRAVGPLAEALDKQDGATKKAASAALTRLLPQLKHGDAGLLDDRQKAYLREGFRKGNREFKLAVLKALPQIGDERFLTPVAVMASSEDRCKKDMELHAQAVECYEALKTRLEEEKTRLTLLHPADSPNDSDKVLLRPAGASESEPNVLLRAVQDSSP